MDAPGSSPLARGTPKIQFEIQGLAGLIPARAGNTALRPSAWERCRAHPRSRGEHSPTTHGVRTVWGSSPLARGTPVFHAQRQVCTGLIPARAGNTGCSRTERRVHRAHPRSRGEHSSEPLTARTSQGSSPLARGTLRAANMGKNVIGLIPARAGNTSKMTA